MYCNTDYFRFVNHHLLPSITSASVPGCATPALSPPPSIARGRIAGHKTTELPLQIRSWLIRQQLDNKRGAQKRQSDCSPSAISATLQGLIPLLQSQWGYWHPSPRLPVMNSAILEDQQAINIPLGLSCASPLLPPLSLHVPLFLLLHFHEELGLSTSCHMASLPA